MAENLTFKEQVKRKFPTAEARQYNAAKSGYDAEGSVFLIEAQVEGDTLVLSHFQTSEDKAWEVASICMARRK